MKNIIVLVVLLFAHTVAQSTIYRVSVMHTDKKATFGVGGSGPNAGGKVDFFDFSCQGACEGIVDWKLNTKAGDLSSPIMKSVTSENPGSRFKEMNEYLSETGQVFFITDLMAKYEKMLLSQKEIEFHLVDQETPDIVYSLSKKDNYYIIFVFTGEHAKQAAEKNNLD